MAQRNHQYQCSSPAARPRKWRSLLTSRAAFVSSIKISFTLSDKSKSSIAEHVYAYSLKFRGELRVL